MKRFFKTLLLVLVISLSIGVLVFAGEAGNGDDTSEGKVDPHSSVSGYSKYRSGYLIYITDAAGTPVSSVRLVPFSGLPASSVNKQGLRTRVTGDLYTDFYDGTIATATNGGYNKPPLDVTTGATFGASFKNWLITKDATGVANVFTLINNLFGSSYSTSFKDEDYYLCIEAVAWVGIKSSANPTMVAGTTKTLNEIFSAAGSTYLANTRQCRLPHAGYLVEAWAGCSVPTIHEGKKESIEDLTADCNGYGIIMVTSSEIEPTTQEPEPPAQVDSDDYIKANELNFIFSDFIPSTTAGRSSEHYSSVNDGKNKVDMNNTANWYVVDTEGIYRNCRLKDDKWFVSESISSDIVNFYGKGNALFYRSTAGSWKKPTEAKEFGTSSSYQYPGYGYLISRPLWGDDLVVCDYRGNGKTYESYITNILKYQLGHNGGLTGVSAGTNIESKISTKKSDSYTFQGNAVEEYEYNDKIHHDAVYENQLNSATGQYEPVCVQEAYDEDNWVSKTADITQKSPASSISYSVSHALYKYVPYDIGVVPNDFAGEATYVGGHIANATTKAVFVSQFNETLSMYPEVKYSMYVQEQKEEWAEPSKVDVYCMGEKERSCLPASMHGYRVYFSQGGHLSGKTIVDVPLTGTDAYEFKTKFGDKSQEIMPVSAQGSGFETVSTNFGIIDVTSFTLDLYDGDINGFNPHETWTTGNPQDSHDTFTNAILNNIDAEIQMKRYTSVLSEPFGKTYDMSFDYTKNISGTTKKQIRIEYANGRITKGKAEVLSEIASAYGVTIEEAENIFNNWGLEVQLDRMLESSKDANNSSGVSGVTSNRWYDESSVCFAITVCNSKITIGNIIFSDKNDYGSSTSQNEYDLSSVGKNGVQARFYFTLKFIDTSLSVDGFDFDISNKMTLVDNDEIKGARFLISDATTHDLIRH